MSNFWNRLNLRNIIAIMLIVSFTIVITSLSANAINETEGKEKISIGIDYPDGVVQEFIRIIKEKDYDNTSDFFDNIEYIGKESDKDYEGLTNIMSLDEAENQEIIGKKNDAIEPIDENKIKHDILLKQENKISELFGTAAWENVEYTLEKIDCPIKEERTIDKRTNEVLTIEESEERNKEFWADVFASEGIEPEYYNEFPFNADIIGVEKTDKLYQILAEHREESPIVSLYTPLYETYKVQFQFNDKKVADTGENDFNIVIMEINGEWKLYTGLQWITPIPEPEEDI